MISKISVLIVGAGPTGLIHALWLKKKGISFRILDKNLSSGQTSRALAVQARTLELYRQLGIAEMLIERGIVTRDLVMRRRGQVIAEAHLGAMGEGLSPYPHLLFCSQDVHEAMLCEVLSGLGVKIERQKELRELVQDQDGVRAIVQGPQGTETIEAEYVVGCDGAHSTVRHSLGFEFPGGTYSQIFFVADVEAMSEARRNGVQVSVSREDFCIIMPIKVKDSVRLTGLVPKASETKKEISFEDVRSSVVRNTGLTVNKVNWFSSYRVHHRVVSHFRDRRVFLCGDAAHIHSPAGGQGMNTGIGDSINLAWKLADVIAGRASPSLLDTYETERLAFAKTLVQTTDRAFRIIASRSRIGSLFRAYILPNLFAALANFRAFQRLAFRTVSQIRIHYRHSQISKGSEGAIHGGDRLPWVESLNNFDALRSLNWQVHIYGEAKASFKKFCVESELDYLEFPFCVEAEAKGFEQDSVYLVRPDGYVSFVSQTQSSEDLKAYLRAFRISET